MSSCQHPYFTIDEEAAPGGTYLVSRCGACGAEMGRTFVPN